MIMLTSISKVASYATIISLFLSVILLIIKIIRRPDFFLFICDSLDRVPERNVVIYLNGKRHRVRRIGKYKGMAACRLEDIGKIVAVHDRRSGRHLGVFKLARKPDETIVKHVLDC